MKNKKNGFTLIELLAVIIVLAIIALIATPIIFNVIENAKITIDTIAIILNTLFLFINVLQIIY